MSKKLEDTDIVDCVVEQVKHSEETTTPDRDRWKLASTIFAGKYESGPTSEDRQEEAKVGLHTFSKICRAAASSAQELLHQDPKFYDFVPPEGEEMDLFGRAVEKIHRHRVKELKIENHTYKFVLAGAISGIGINKFQVIKEIEDDEEYLLSLLEEEREKESKAISPEIKKTTVVAGDGVDATGQLGILDMLEGGAGKKKISKKGSKLLSYNIKMKIVNPLNFFWDPACESINDSSWVAERYFIPFNMLEPGFKSGTFKNKDQLTDLLSVGGSSGSTSINGADIESQKLLYEDKYYKASPYAPIVEVIEYYGPILERSTGKTLQEHQRVIIANGKVVLAHGPNSNWKRKSPYFISTTSHVPFKGVGAGIADNGIDQELIGNEIMNLALQHLAFTVKGVKAVDVSALDDATDLETGFYPGQLVGMRPGDGRSVKDSFHDLDYNPNLTFPVMQMLEKLELSASAGASVDTSGSNPSSRARISASEIRANTDKTSRSQFTLARELDETYLEELLTRVLDFVLQYDLENQPLQEFVAAGIIAESEYRMISAIPTHERLKEAKRRYRLDVRGFRERLERNEFLSRLSEYMQQINMLVQISPEMKPSINFKKIIQMFSEAYGLSGDDILIQNSPHDAAREENSILRNDRQIEVMPNDEHGAHLPVHYDLLMQAQNEATINHVRNHIMNATQGGVGFPPVPPELELLIYGPPPEQEDGPPQGQQDGQGNQSVGAPVPQPVTFQ